MRHVHILVRFLALLLGTLPTCWPRLAASQVVLDQTPVTEFNVLDVAKSGNTVYLAGDFTYVGPVTGGSVQQPGGYVFSGSSVVLDGTTGAVTAGFLRGGFTAIAADGSGGWYVGRFGYLAHILADMSIDPNWNPTVKGANMAGRGAFVRAIAVHGSAVFIGGQYDSLNGQPRGVLTAVDATTGALLPFNASITFNGAWTVNALAISGSTLFVGGQFSSMGGQARQNLAALDVTTGNALAWTANTDSYNRQVHTLLVDGSNLYVGGEFIGLGGLNRNRLARVDVSTAAVSTWNPNGDGTVYALALQGTTLYAGGSFGALGGAFRNRIAAIGTVAHTATGWNPGADDDVFALAVIGGTVYVGGDFKNIGGQVRWRAAAIEVATGLVTAWKANSNGTVVAVFPRGADIIMSGGSSFGGEPRNFLAAFNATTGALLPWNPDPNGPVFALAADGTNVYLGGTFTTVGGVDRNHLASVSATTGAVNSWNPSAHGGLNFSYPHDLELSGNTLYVGGEFTMISGTSRDHLAAFDTQTGNLTPWNPAANGVVEKIFPYGGVVYVGGSFTAVGGAPRVALAALDPMSGNATGWDPGPDQGPVYGIATDGTSLYAAGGFTAIGGYFRRYLGAVDLVTGFGTPFDPNPSAIPRSLAVIASNLYVLFENGSNVTIGGGTRSGLAELGLPGGSVTAWVPPISSLLAYGRALLLDGLTLYLGGGFYATDPTWGLVQRGVVGIHFSNLVGVGESTGSRADLDLAIVPNPTSGPFRMRLALPRDSQVRVQVFDLQGRQIENLVNRWLPAGVHELRFQAARGFSGSTAGLGFVRVEAAGTVRVERLVFLP